MACPKNSIARIAIGYIAVPKQTSGGSFKVRLANGCACGTPANIILNRFNVWPEESEGGGNQ